MNDDLTIMIGGDLIPTELNEKYFLKDDFLNYLDNNFVQEWLKSDFRIFNFEGVLCEKSYNKLLKNGPNLRANPKCIKGLQQLSPDLVLLANNHSLDYGIDGLKSMLNLFKKYNIKYTGLIDNSSLDFQSAILEKRGIKIGIYNVYENEFSVATENSFGTNGLNIIKNCKEIEKLKKEVNYVIVFFHGGKEYYNYVSPECQKICRTFIDNGADIVITQHSHCIGCKETYNNKEIIYGQGDFIFNRKNFNGIRNNSLLINVSFSSNSFNINYIPIQKNNIFFDISKDDTIINGFNQRSENIKNKDFVTENYNRFTKNLIFQYLCIINPPNIIRKIYNKIFKKSSNFKIEDYLKIKNIIECEAHREAFINGLNGLIEGKKNEK